MNETVNFLCLKWGDKYGPEYVNRLHSSIRRTYSGPFNFHCFTDDVSGLKCETSSISSLRSHGSKVFTAEKLDLFKSSPFRGPHVLLDLDVLVMRDLSEYFNSYRFCEPRFIKCLWQPPHRIYESYFRGDCYVNSSFVTWRDDQLEWVHDKFYDNLDVAKLKMKSFDKFLFYSSRRKLNFHPAGVVYAYSFGSEWPDERPQVMRPEYFISIFNTSHKSGVELDQAGGWAKEMWVGYDD